MLQYTICFIRHGDMILLLNRQFPSWMGAWNGIGGKREEGETPAAAVTREVFEETGLAIEMPRFRGVTTWYVEGKCVGGMYVFAAELPTEQAPPLRTPVNTTEGILDWKEIDWVLHPKNQGVASDIPRSLLHILGNTEPCEHRCFYEDEILTNYRALPLDEEMMCGAE